MIAIVCGSRKFHNYNYLKDCLDSVLDEDDQIVTGGAKGTDIMAETYAIFEMDNRAKIFRPDWDTWGKIAGPMRNQEMAGYARRAMINGESAICIAFLPKRGKSNGTQDMIKKARNADIEVLIFRT